MPKIYELSLSRNYVAHWGLLQAVRELIQNNLDSESPFEYYFGKGSGEDSGTNYLELCSRLSTLTPSTLLLGTTSKSNDTSAIGNFGEGFKIALLVLTRLGNSVTIQNGDKVWVPAFRFSEQFQDDVLVIEETDGTVPNEGLTFTVEGITDEEVSQIVESCLKLQQSAPELAETKETTFGSILLSPKYAGRLYIGSLLICDTNLNFGYDVKPEYLKLERDRQTVSDYELAEVTAKMWVDTKQYDLIAQMLFDDKDDVKHVDMFNKQVQDACYKLFREKYPDQMIATNQSEADAINRQGFSSAVVMPYYFSSVVKQDARYVSDAAGKVRTPKKILEDFLEKYQNYMSSDSIYALKDIIANSAPWKLR